MPWDKSRLYYNVSVEILVEYLFTDFYVFVLFLFIYIHSTEPICFPYRIQFLVFDMNYFVHRQALPYIIYIQMTPNVIWIENDWIK